MNLEEHWPRLVFGIALVVLGAFEAHRRWRAGKPSVPRAPSPIPASPKAPRSPVAFGPKTAWLAVRSDDPTAVIASLGLESVERIDWANGVEQGYATRVFVSPPVRGWVLVMSSAPELIPDGEALQSGAGLAVRMSAELQAEVQHFWTLWLVEAHAWLRADRGKLLRAYVFGDDGAVDIGQRAAAEAAVGDFFDPDCDDAASDEYWERTDLRHPSEQDVFAVAGAWSLDPTAFDAWDGEMADGWVGDLECSPP